MDNNIIAVIDIGSNSVRIQVARIIDKTYKVINEYKAILRLGDSIYKTGYLPEEAIEKLIYELSNMKKILESENVGLYRAVATASLRDSINGIDVVKRIKKDLGLDVEIISGEEEARLIFLAASYYIHMSEDNILFIDMGGGSAEFSYAEKGELKFAVSTPLGAVRLHHQFLDKDEKPSKVQLSLLKDYIFKDVLKDILPKMKVTKIVCSGGTLNNISMIYSKRHNESDSAIKFVDNIFLKHFYSEIVSKNLKERLKISGIEPARADIIVPSSVLIYSLVKKYHLDGFYTLSGGLRSGLTIDLMNRLGIELLFQGSYANVHYARLIEIGKKYYFDEAHALQVSYLAKIIFDQLKSIMDLKDNDWKLLEASSLLHDIGQYIAYSKHHKHSYYLIKNTELSGFSDKDITLIANIARYHRRSIPKVSHDNLIGLSKDEILKIQKLAGILRVADGLDRTHSSLVSDINITITPNVIGLHLSSDGEISMEEAGFEKKKDLLEKVLKREIRLI